MQAQATPPAYAVIVIRKINDADAYQPVQTKVRRPPEAAGGKIVILTDKVTSLDDGVTLARYVVVRFDNMEKALAWHNSRPRKRRTQSE
jgi:uncharacterized protein (DUF1330 family)